MRYCLLGPFPFGRDTAQLFTQLYKSTLPHYPLQHNLLSYQMNRAFAGRHMLNICYFRPTGEISPSIVNSERSRAL